MKRLFLAVTALCGTLLILVPPMQAATYNWDPNANRSDAAGSGTWDTTTSIWDNGAADVVWPNGGASPFSMDTAVFGGADGNYTVTAVSGLKVGLMTVNTSGYTLAGASSASPGTLYLSSGGSGVLNVATGKTLTVGANMTVTSGNGSYINASSSPYAGNVVVNNGGVFNLDNANIGGTFTVGANGTGSSPGTSPTVVNGGTLNINGANASFVTRGLGVSTGAVINVNNGTFNTAGAFGLYMNGGSLNVNGGTYVAGYTAFSNAAGSTIRLNGGLIVNSTAGYGSSIGSNTITALVQSGGARISGGGGSNIIVNSGLLHDSTGPAVDGGLIISGAGTVTLNVAGTYTGGTMVSAGTLVAAANGALGSGNASVIATSVSLKINAGVTTPFNNPLARLTLAGGGTANIADVGYLDLTSGTNITVGSLVLGTTPYASGTFSSANFPEYFSGTGTLTVVPEPTSLACALVLAGVLGIGFRRRRIVRS